MNMLAINILLALGWMAMNADFSLTGLVAGFVLSHGILWLARPLFPRQTYFRRLWGGIAYTLWLMLEIWKSALVVAKGVLGIGPKPCPAIIAIPLDAKTDWEIALFACSITLTPGTLTLDIAPDRKTLYMHALFAADPDAVRDDTKSAMESRILKVLR